MGFSPVTCNAVCRCFNYGFLFKLQRLILHPWSPSHRVWKFFGGIHQSLWLFCSLLCLRLRRAPWFTPFCFGFISSGELLRLETRLIRAVGTGGGGAGGESGGRVVGRKPKAMSLKKTLNSRGERTVEPAIISWQWFLSPPSRTIMENTDQFIRAEIRLLQCYVTVITSPHDTYSLTKAWEAVYTRAMLIIMPSLRRPPLPLLPPLR